MMKLIAFTADLHLTTRLKNPERYNALADILTKAVAREIATVILAGDTFDETSRNYAEFEAFCQQEKFRNLRLILIPGNHDSQLNPGQMTAKNVEIVSEACIRTFGENGMTFLFLPYVKDATMGEFIAAHAAALKTNPWILVGHGDWTEGMHQPDPSEPGIYMPLTRTDIENFRPARAILGHIHKPMESDVVSYIGSPCGLDIRETGRRRFLILDTESGAVESQVVDSDILHFNESFMVVPAGNEIEYVKQQIAERILGWQLTKKEMGKARIQMRFYGYSSNRRALQEAVLESFKAFRFYRDGEPDFSEVSTADDANLLEIARRVKERLQQTEFPQDDRQPDKEQILLQALHVIYGG